MQADRGCRYVMPDGRACRASALKGEHYCLFHSPEHQEEAAEIRRLGGLRRRKEKSVTGAYDLEGLSTVAGINRLVEIAVLDVLSLENSLARSRTLGYLAGMAIRCLEMSEIENRLAAIEQAVHATRADATPAFDIDIDPIEDEPKELEP